jgi:uncharacterized protein
MRRCLAFLVLLPAILIPSSPRADTWTARPANYPGTPAVTRDVAIMMSDDVTLRADIIRPVRADGTIVMDPLPVVLTQTPYNKVSPLNFRSDYLVQRGYIQVIVDVRGTGGSAGKWHSFDAREQLDSAELVDWVIDQPFYDGNGIALHGTSYAAINQLFTAATGNAHIKALFPIVPMSDAYRDITLSGGEINTSFIPLWLGLVTALSSLPPTYIASDPAAALKALADHAQGAAEFQAATVATAMTGGENAYDGSFYRTRSPIEVIDSISAPTWFVGGWYDLFQRGTPLLFERMRANGRDARLMMGPWYHITAGNGLMAPNTLPELELRWFDHHVLGVNDPGLDARDRVDLLPYGKTAWESATSWPVPGMTYEKKFLSDAGLSAAPPSTAEAPETMVWHPGAGACTRSTAQWTAGGTIPPCETNNRINDALGLTYDMAVPSGLDLAGPVSAHLYVSTNAKDSFLAARLEDVAADGTATQISAGWQILSMRKMDNTNPNSLWVGDVAARPYHPFTAASQLAMPLNDVVDVWVEIFPVAAHIAGGHTLRLAIQPSDAPHLTPSAPVTLGLAGGILSLYHDATHPSYVALPVAS